MAVLQVKRQEIKYQISLLEYKKLERNLKDCMRQDEYAGTDGTYRVRSLYFDTPLEKDRMDVLRGGEKRRKIRIRVYSPDDKTAKLELKEKEGRFQKKTSLPVTREEAEELIQGRFECLRKKNTKTAEHLYMELVRGMYRPRVMVEYQRAAFYIPFQEVRVTFDWNAAANRMNTDLFAKDICWTPLRPSSVGVLEVKFNGYLFSYVQNLLEEVEKLPTMNGKYIYACKI